MLYVRYDDRSPCPDAADPDVRTTDLSLGRMENQKASPNDQNGICDYVYHVQHHFVNGLFSFLDR